MRAVDLSSLSQIPTLPAAGAFFVTTTAASPIFFQCWRMLSTERPPPRLSAMSCHVKLFPELLSLRSFDSSASVHTEPDEFLWRIGDAAGLRLARGGVLVLAIA